MYNLPTVFEVENKMFGQNTAASKPQSYKLKKKKLLYNDML